MTPITFASSFGWFHDARGRCGIVLCAAQGHEDLCTHKSLRLMADAFAACGYPSLRFDYAGTGDSIGHEFQENRIEAWITSIEEAVKWLRANARVDQVVLVGLRLGSTLAALAADRLGSIAGLILLAPVPSGRAYVRELSTLSSLIQKRECGDTGKAANIDIGGFIMTPAMAKEISAIDLKTLRKAPAPSVLWIAIEGQTSANKLANYWSELGSHVEQRTFSHYAEFMLDPAFSRFPAEALQHALNWLTAHFDPGSSKAPRRQLPPYKPHETDYFSEFPVLFGANRNLFGMLCMPKDFAYDRPTVIYITEGANHHIGWGHLTIQTCRKLAEFGLASLRIDTAGIGDSPDAEAGQDQFLYRDESTKDVSAAIDWLEAQGFHNITVIGHCAGAHLGFHTAVADPRISRIVMVNLQRFIWNKGDALTIALNDTYRSNSFYLKRLLMLDTWRRLLSGDVNIFGIARALAERFKKKALASFLTVSSRLGFRTSGAIGCVKDWMKVLDERKVQQCYVFSTGDAGIHELSLFRPIRAKPSRRAPHVSVALIKDADHILSQREARVTFVDILQRILCSEKGKTPDRAIRPIARVFNFPKRISAMERLDRAS